jgi:Uma2 family endonuclease
MSSSHVQPAFMTLDEYLTFEEASDRRHEYVNGQVHAMVGVTRSHSRIAGNIAGRMWAAARGRPCQVHHGDFKVKVGDVVYYPDVMATCSGTSLDPWFETAPSIVVEVLSPSTERTDRGEKAMVYRRIPSLDSYLVVEQDRRVVEHHWRDPNRQWERTMLVDGGDVRLISLGLILTLDEIYEGVDLPSREEWLRLRRLREEEAVYG